MKKQKIFHPAPFGAFVMTTGRIGAFNGEQFLDKQQVTSCC
jgi:hypothetical protein